MAWARRPRALQGLDVGDFVGVRGRPFRTKTGELTVQVAELALLSKSLRRCRTSGMA